MPDDLRSMLAREAARVTPRSDLGDLERRIRRRAVRRRRIARNSVGAIAVLCLGAVLFATVRPGAPGSPATPLPPSPVAAGAVVIDALPSADAGGTLERIDEAATADGPEVVVARPVGGGLGSGRVLAAGDALPPNWEVVGRGPARPPSVREARYGCEPLGEGEALGAGLCYAALTDLVPFEAALYRDGSTPGPVVAGRPTVVSHVGGGNATLAWELTPGRVAFVGYSGSAFGAAQEAALARLAARARAVSPPAWAASRPQVVAQRLEW
jgi:hypothetical protein